MFKKDGSTVPIRNIVDVSRSYKKRNIVDIFGSYKKKERSYLSLQTSIHANSASENAADVTIVPVTATPMSAL